MVKFETLDSYRKMKLWINEAPEKNNNILPQNVSEYNANDSIHWFNGILCLELRIAPRAASNYAMLCLRFTEIPYSKFQVKYDLNLTNMIVQSDIAMPNDVVRTGIPKEYYSALMQVFTELEPQNCFPCGTLEILGGRYALIGSSNIAFKIVLKNLINLFELNKELEHYDINSLILQGCK